MKSIASAHRLVTNLCLVFVSLVACAALASAASAAPNEAQAPSCVPVFPYKEGWLGGDAAFSIPLPDGRSLWLFGDSFVGRANQANRPGSKMVRNAIALSTCDPKTGWDIHYYWQDRHKKAPASFFDLRTGDFWYWPGDGIFYRDSVYVVLWKMKPKPEEKIFSFKTAGAVLAKISNISAAPDDWQVTYLPLLDIPNLVLSTSAVVQDGYVYLFTLWEDDAHGRPTLLARLPLTGLAEPAPHLQYLDQNNQWKPGFDPEKAFVVMDKGASELSVRYHLESKIWVAISGEPLFISNKIVARTARNLTGPWSAMQPVYEIKELVPSTPGWDKDTFCYAEKEHIEFAQGANLFITYVCNSYQFSKLVSNMSLYRPQPVRVHLPESLP
ncbi:MAG: hypothetical protein NVS9B4_01900 [Candidatus Acidiferrum sp.]